MFVVCFLPAESDGHPRRARRKDQQTFRQSRRVQSVSGRIQDHSRVHTHCMPAPCRSCDISGVYLVNFRVCFRCSLDDAKRGFYRAANSIFGSSIGRVASEEVVIQLM